MPLPKEPVAPKERKKCARCNGTGIMKVFIPGAGWTEKKCPYCLGLGSE